MSNTYYYRSLMEGTFSGLWSSAFPHFGNGAIHGSLGDRFDQSKMYIAKKTAGANPLTGSYSNAVNHVRLYHLLGDPTLAPWLGNPVNLEKQIILYPLPDYLDVHYGEEGAI